MSLSARRAWIEIPSSYSVPINLSDVALRKESVDRNVNLRVVDGSKSVALRKESVDRNVRPLMCSWLCGVALRKESVDRNLNSLQKNAVSCHVALRKESVDRNVFGTLDCWQIASSLSARRAWIEISSFQSSGNDKKRRSPQGERG